MKRIRSFFRFSLARVPCPLFLFILSEVRSGCCCSPPSGSVHDAQVFGGGPPQRHQGGHPGGQTVRALRVLWRLFSQGVSPFSMILVHFFLGGGFAVLLCAACALLWRVPALCVSFLKRFLCSVSCRIHGCPCALLCVFSLCPSFSVRCSGCALTSPPPVFRTRLSRCAVLCLLRRLRFMFVGGCVWCVCVCAFAG